MMIFLIKIVKVVVLGLLLAFDVFELFELGEVCAVLTFIFVNVCLSDAYTPMKKPWLEAFNISVDRTMSSISEVFCKKSQVLLSGMTNFVADRPNFPHTSKINWGEAELFLGT